MMSNKSINLREGLNIIRIPKAETDDYHEIDASGVYESLDRISEIQRATPATSGELMTSFINGMSLTSRLISILEIELLRTKSLLEQAEAIAKLDKVEKVLKEKGYAKSSADLRDAVVILDEDVQKFKVKYEKLMVLNKFFSSKYNEIKEALYATKKVNDANLAIISKKYAGTIGEE